ncbi:cytochrome aa3 quinol oxidase subunit IV [Sinobaca sp. H24]|uniref:cytochrome aa3 quinol oxidase subunit IV n=1 Tax=Sinobaca sp. H24 TaxID=2923376 RepID=UPI00207941F5|nr:cytochrome aa3 quinol oxidase subunit IV [Sinobaca sp. H24]
MSSHSESRFPIKHVIGYISSIVLTGAAAWIALGTELPMGWIVTGIMTLAIIQAGIQLFMFMHITETDSGGIQLGNMIYAFGIAGIIVLGSIWVMSFGYHDHGTDGGGSETEEHGGDH